VLARAGRDNFGVRERMQEFILSQGPHSANAHSYVARREISLLPIAAATLAANCWCSRNYIATSNYKLPWLSGAESSEQKRLHLSTISTLACSVCAAITQTYTHSAQWDERERERICRGGIPALRRNSLPADPLLRAPACARCNSTFLGSCCNWIRVVIKGGILRIALRKQS
jgi:hypothetical protein